MYTIHHTTTVYALNINVGLDITLYALVLISQYCKHLILIILNDACCFHLYKYYNEANVHISPIQMFSSPSPSQQPSLCAVLTFV